MFGISKYLMIGGVVLVFALGAGIYVQKKWHDAAIEKKNQEIAELNAKYLAEKTAHEILKRNFTFMEESIKIQQEEREALEEKFRTADSERKKLQKIFDKHDLTKLSREKPNLIEKIINEGTKKVFEDLERITE